MLTHRTPPDTPPRPPKLPPRSPSAGSDAPQIDARFSARKDGQSPAQRDASSLAPRVALGSKDFRKGNRVYAPPEDDLPEVILYNEPNDGFDELYYTPYEPGAASDDNSHLLDENDNGSEYQPGVAQDDSDTAARQKRFNFNEAQRTILYQVFGRDRIVGSAQAKSIAKQIGAPDQWKAVRAWFEHQRKFATADPLDPTWFSDVDIAVMQQVALFDPYLRENLEYVCHRTGKPPRQIKLWFENERRKQRASYQAPSMESVHYPKHSLAQREVLKEAVRALQLELASRDSARENARDASSDTEVEPPHRKRYRHPAKPKRQKEWSGATVYNRWTKQQTGILQRAMQNNPYPTDVVLQELERKLDAPPRRILRWFENERHRLRRAGELPPAERTQIDLRSGFAIAGRGKKRRAHARSDEVQSDEQSHGVEGAESSSHDEPSPKRQRQVGVYGAGVGFQ